MATVIPTRDWIAVAIVSRRAAAAEDNPRSRWGIWILPWLLSLDNITYGAVDGVSNGAGGGFARRGYDHLMASVAGGGSPHWSAFAPLRSA